MPRHARTVFPGVPHHVTQRGNHREPIFFSPGDWEYYLHLLREQAAAQVIEVVAYCLMPNHVHLVLVPTTLDGLYRALKVVHGHYAQRINRMRELKGHLWQGRYFSSALDVDYFGNAVRYVELNPVRAGLARKAEEYPWSSAAAHCGLRSDPLVTDRPRSGVFAGIGDWSRWLAEGVSADRCEMLRRHSRRNLPCGTSKFIDELERQAGGPLRHRPAGRPARSQSDSACNHAGAEIGERPLLTS